MYTYLIFKPEAYCVRFPIVEFYCILIVADGNHHPIIITQRPKWNQLKMKEG